MNIDYSGKTVVITGGSAGIGLEAAKLFCKSGANVAICGRDASKVESALSEIKQFSGSAIGASCDVTSRAQVFALADKAAETFGRLDVWINNAGHTGKSGLMKVTEEFCENEVNLNFKSVLWGSQAAFKYMREKGGVIINASSYSSIMPGVGVGLYGASKSAVTSITRTLAAELSPYDIRVVGYAPGPILTPLLEESLTGSDANKEAILAGMVMNVSQRRVGQAEEVANLILFLASDNAEYISGTCIDISGGKFAAQSIPMAWNKNNTGLHDLEHPPKRLLE
jgi:NAD(P)-dependent dehydrogenase (short-subunit alcohol dehydrogenase family)